ncbi:uncharacterized protein SCDLUD_004451 [Saccharomycodes ludwigii]|uniref:uncharacterized protein n=1 Tax=Saccharomycodes ludwigii TaxID=36035 RepID=UPI001E8A3809|nr:hypothetical protein SCDLUD_004451 [Saccharomycodes ludwigii]KAH3899029.1 hypothetical protein SCDLUD_004451 [Saccharomycodes ludwigii]
MEQEQVKKTITNAAITEISKEENLAKNDFNSDKIKDLSYDELMDCIQNNKPVSNVIQVEDYVIEDPNLQSKSQLKTRLKPWEQNIDIAKRENTININNKVISQLEKQQLELDLKIGQL